MKTSIFQIFPSGNQFYFRLRAKNMEIILASEAYTSKQMCQKGIEAVKLNASFDERYERLIAKDDSPYFNLKANNGEIIGTSEMYSSAQMRDKGIEVVKTSAPFAEVQDLS